MRVAFAMQAFCARRHKFYELMKDEHDIELFCLWKARNDSDSPAKLNICKNNADLHERIKKGKFDVVHVFTDYTDMANRLMKTEKVVIDTYDVGEMRGTKDNFAEVVYSSKWPKLFSSEKHQEYLTEKYDIKDKTWVIPNCPLRKWVENLGTNEKLPGENIIYYGGVSLSTASDYGYRLYIKQFRKFADAGIKVHIFPANTTRGYKIYEGKNIILHKKVDHGDLLQELTKYQVGFLGYNDLDVKPVPVAYAKTCLPNKTFDYMMAGIPSLSYNLGYAEKFVKNWGICCSNVDDLVDGYYKAKELNLAGIDKNKYYLENYRETLNSIYDLANSL